MVAIVSGNSLGLNLTSLRTLGPQDFTGVAAHGRNNDRTYVNVATGNLVVQGLEAIVAAHGEDISALRTYNSRGRLDDDNRDNWSNGFYRNTLEFAGTLNAAGSTIKRTDRDGSVALYAFRSLSEGYQTTDGDGAHDIIKLQGGEFVWEDGSTGLKQAYEGTGQFRLLRSEDPTGNILVYDYDPTDTELLISVRSGATEGTYYTYTGGNLESVSTKDAAGTVTTRVRYGYDAKDRLATVTVDLSPENNDITDGKVYLTTYTYEGDSKRISTITQTDGTQLTFEYDDSSYEVTSVTDALGHVTTFTYGDSFTNVKSHLGHVTRYTYDGSGQLTGIASPPASGTSPSRAFEYEDGNVEKVTDEEGRAVTFEYDERGNQLRQRDSAGNVVTRTFDQRNQLKAETIWLQPDPDGGEIVPTGPRTTRYVYNEEGDNLLRFVVTADGRVTQHTYDGFGDRRSSITYTNALLSSTVGWTESALQTWANGQPVAAVQLVAYKYDSRGELEWRAAYATVNALGQGETEGRTWERFIHDQSGRLLQSISGTGTVTNYVYDGLGRQTSIDASGQITTTDYRDAQGKIRITLANGLVSTSAFDAAGRLMTVAETKGAAELGTTTYVHDADNRLRMVTDPTQVSRWILYDAAGRKTADIDGNRTMTEYRYDASGRITYSVTYSTAVTASLAVTEADRTVGQVRPDAQPGDNRTWYAYDGAGRLFRTARSSGPDVAVTETKYDGASRVETVVQYATLLVPSVDPVAPGAIPAPAGSADDRVSRYFYDGDGHRIGSLDAEGYLVVVRHDAAGRQSERIAYASRTPAALREAGSLAQLEPDAIGGADIRNVFFYDGQGRLVAEVDGEGYLTETGYDLAGRVNSIRRYRNPAIGSVTPESRLSDIRPNDTVQDWLTTRSYDASGRLWREVNHEGTVTTFAYDEVGNLASTTRASGTEEWRTSQVRHDPQGRIVAELPPVGVAHLQEALTPEQVEAVWADFGVTHAYDLAGRRISTSDAHGHKTVFFYDEDGALRFQVNAMGDVQELVYDVQGRLAQRIGYVQRISTTDLAGGLDASLVTSRLPQGEASVSRTTFVYRRDGSLEKTIDSLGNVVLHGYNAFGEVVRTEQLNDATGNLVQVQERDRRGLVTRSNLDPADLELETSTVYDAFGRAISMTDANGWTRAQAYDRLGRIVTRKDAFDTPRTTTYNAFGQVLTEVDALGQATTFTYNVVTRTVKVATPEQHVTTTVRNRHGEVSKFTDGAGYSTDYAYDAGGKTLEVTSPLGTTTRQAYDAAGLLRDEWDASGTRVHYDYDDADRLSARTVDPGGLRLVTTYAYDGMGRQVTVTDPSGVVTKVEYDLESRVLSRTVDSGGLNIKTRYSYDAADRVLAVTDPAGSVTLYGYDVAGRRTSECVDAGGLNLTKTWTYDGNDNVETATDANGNITRYTYDRENRLTFTVIEGTGSVTRRIYDAAGNVVRSIAYATPLPAGSAPQDVSVTATDRITSMAYDRDGRLVFEVDAMKGVVERVLDGNGRVVRRIAYAKPIGSVPALGQPSTVADLRQALVTSPAEDRSTRYAYDGTGRLVYTIDATGAVQGTDYRDAESITVVTRYARRIEVGEDWSVASVMGDVDATDPANRAETHRYDKAGRLESTTDALGFTESYTYDDAGHKKTFTNKKGDTWLYDYDGGGRLVKETSPALSLASISVDGTMTRTQEAGRVITLLAYDGAGRLKSRTEAAGRAEERTTIYGYDAAGRQVSVRWDSVRVYDAGKDTEPVTQGLAARSEKTVRPETSTFYDAVGNAVANIDIGGALSQKTYDAAGRLLYEVDALGYVTQYERNAFGEVIQLTRYAQATTLANRTVSQSADAVRTVTIEARLSAEGVDHADDRFVATDYDRMGRVTQTREHSAFVFDPGSAAAGQTGNSAKSTEIVYNAFGEAVEVKSLRNAVNDAWAVTSNYYDNLGRQVGAIDALGQVTARSYDVFGNLASTTEYARGLAGPWTSALFQTPTPGSGDRTVRYGYDKGNRKVEEARVNVEYSTASDGTAVRGDLVSTFSYDAVGNQTVVIDPLNRRTTTYYDVLGRVAAVASPRRSVVNADGALGSVNPLVKFFRDAHGNVIEHVEYANGSSELNGDAAVSNAQLDRRTLTRYDGLGRAIEVKDPLGASRYMSYDVYGNVAKQWQLVSGQTSYTVNVYDKVGQLVETRRPASTMRIQPGITAQLIRGVGYAPLAQDTLRLEWSTLLGDATGDVRVVVEYVAAAYTMTNSQTEEQTTVPAVTRTVTQTGTAASAAGGMNVSWLGSTQEVNSILVQQKVGDGWVTRWTGEMADANGSSLTEVSQKAAGENVTGVRYNAFGEVTAKGSGTATLNDWQEYFDYDAAGRLWRTNSGDGVDKIYLYDAQGNRTSELRSTGAGRNDLDVRSLTSAASAEAKSMRRTDFTYDLAGRLTRTIHPERLEEQGGVAVQRMVLGASIVTAVNGGPRAEDEGGGYGWNGTNEVTLSWNNLNALGSGDVKVSITYTSTLGISRTRESGDLLAKDGAQGTRITWSPGGSSDEGIQQVTRIVLWKKDVDGTWRKIADQAPGSGSNVIDLAAPGDLRTTEFLRLRKTGTTTWITANLLDFGDSRRYLGTADLVTGTYEYLMGVTPPGGAEQVVATGTLQLKADGTLVQTPTDNQDVSWVRPVVSQILDRWGNVLQVTDPRSADWVTTYKYNANNQLVMQTLPEEVTSTRIYYDAVGRQVAVRDALDRVNGQVYDGGGNLYREIHADGGTPTYRYDVFGQKASVTDALGHTVSYRYDRGGNLLEMRKGTEGVYTVQPNMTVTALGELEIVERWTYDERGQKLTHANGENEITSYRYDLVGNVVARTQPLQQTTYTAYDASGRKTTELDGNLNAARWTYDYFGQLQEHQDIGGARYTYSYDNARQLTMQTNTRGQKLTYRHDAAGQVLAITDWDGSSNKVSSYAYDLAGNRLREKTVEGGVTYQDNHLGYDARGRLRDVADARVHMTLWYDAVGNRSRVKTSVNYQGVEGEEPYASDRHYLYDSMNRQVVVGALDAAGELMDSETHKVAYDLNGNRVSDTYMGTRIGVGATSVPAIASYTADGVAEYNSAATYVKQENRQIVERYTYDDLNRLETVVRSGMQVDVRRYDAADRVVSSGVANLPQPYRELLQDAIDGGQLGAINKYVNRFNDNGQLQRQVIYDAANAPQTDIIWEAGQVFGPGDAFRPAGYDGAGNVAGYAVINRSTGDTTTYSTTFKRFDSYQADATTGTSTSGSHGNNVQVYDTNGFLVQVLDGTDTEHNRTFVNDAQGRALFVEQGQTARRQLIVNGEVMGAYGVGLHELAPWDGGDNPNYANLADFNFSYSKVTGSYPAPSPGAYVVRPGDTLQSVAQGAYGDASLWYVIAQANGLDSPDAMRVGQTLNIPNRVGTTGNSEHVFKPYDPSRVTGDLTPNMPMPEAGCGGVGQILIIVVAVVVTIFTAGAAAAALGAAASATSGVAAASAVSLSSTFASGVAALSGSYGLAGAAAAVVGGAVGSTVSQGFAVAAGIQQDFNWKAVALSAISAGMGAGVGSIANATGILAGGQAHAVIGRAMISNAASQGVSVALGLQDRFDWRGVAASGMGAAVGHVVGDALGMHSKDFATATPFGEQVAKRFVAGVAAGTAASLARGGKVVVEQVAIDAFGNALGQSMADMAIAGPNTAVLGGGAGNSQASGNGTFPNTPEYKEMLTARGTPFAEIGDKLVYASIDRNGQFASIPGTSTVDVRAYRGADGSINYVERRDDGTFDLPKGLEFVSVKELRAGQMVLGRDFGPVSEWIDAANRSGVTAGDPVYSLRRQVAVNAALNPALDAYIDSGTGQVNPLQWVDFLNAANGAGLPMSVTSNGLGNFYQQARDNVRILADGKNALTVGVYNPTTDGNFLKDVIREALLANLVRQQQTVQVAIQSEVSSAVSYNRALDEFFGRRNGSTITDFIGHSQGTINGNLALDRLSDADKSVVRGVSVGTASWHLPKGLHEFINVYDVHDPVTIGTGGHAISYDPYAIDRGGAYRVMTTNMNEMLSDAGNNHSFYLYAQMPEFKSAVGFVSGLPPVLTTKPF